MQHDEPVKIKVVSSGPSYAMWILSTISAVVAVPLAGTGNWKLFAGAALWSVICAIRSNGL